MSLLWLSLAALGLGLSVAGMALPEDSLAQRHAFALACWSGAAAIIAFTLWGAW